jgi:Glycosyl transferase family 2
MATTRVERSSPTAPPRSPAYPAGDRVGDVTVGTGTGASDAPPPAGGRGGRPCGVVLVMFEEVPRRELLDALRDQVDWLIVVDNSITPAIREQVKQQCAQSPVRYALLQSPENLGTARGFNAGALAAKSHGCETVFFLDGDAVVTPGFFQSQIRMLETIEANDRIRVGALTSIVSDDSPSMDPPAIARAWSPVRTIITSGSLVRVSTFESAGRFNEKLFVEGVDFDFSRRMRASGHVLARVNRVLVRQPFGRPLRAESSRVRALERLYAEYHYVAILAGLSNSYLTRLSRYSVARRAELVRGLRADETVGFRWGTLSRMARWASMVGALVVDSISSGNVTYLRLMFADNP